MTAQSRGGRRGTGHLRNQDSDHEGSSHKDTSPPKNADPFEHIDWDDENVIHARTSRKQGSRPIIRCHTYEDEGRNPVLNVGRVEPTKEHPNRFVQWLPDGTWSSLKGETPPVYRLPEVIAALGSDVPIHVAEGERDADRIAETGAVATCILGGAPGTREALASLDVLRRLGGASEVVVWQDKDPAGQRYVRNVVQRLAALGIDNVRVVEAKEGNDAADHLDAGYSLDETVELPLPEVDPDAGHSGQERADVVIDVLERFGPVTGGDGQWDACCPAHDDKKPSLSISLGADAYLLLYCQRGCDYEEVKAALFDLGVPEWVFRPSRGAHLSTFPYTDLGNAERLAMLHGDVLRYVHASKTWLVWDGARWKRDATAEVERRAKDTVRRTFQSAADLDEDDQEALMKFARRSEAKPRLDAMMRLAQSEDGISVEPNQLDRDRWALNVVNGTLDLRTGKLRAHDPADLNTKLAPVSFEPGAECPTWERFLGDVLPDPDDRAFVRRAVGYCLTADISEHVLFVLHGTGRNGKSTFLEVLRKVLGDYAQQAPSELLLAQQRGSSASEDIARLRGARFVATSETEENRRLAESVIKQLTGGDTLVARVLYGSLFEFEPTHKLWLATNHLPQVRGTDEAIWSRLKQVPFTVTIPKERQDRHLKDKLLAEARGILRWAVDGCMEWRRHGLGESVNVTRATETYREESDVFGRFLEDCCDVGPGQREATGALYAVYCTWAANQGLKPMSQVYFGRKLAERPEGFRKVKLDGGGARGWEGIALRKASSQGGPKLRIVAGDEEVEV